MITITVLLGRTLTTAATTTMILPPGPGTPLRRMAMFIPMLTPTP